jgi:hypothetical protein
MVTSSATATPDDLEDDATPDSSRESVTATVAPAVSATIVPGQVSESQGQFVTSSSRTSRYYYARDDNGWHRIHADHRIWFASEEDLKNAFPARALHLAKSTRATRTATPVAPN